MSQAPERRMYLMWRGMHRKGQFQTPAQRLRICDLWESGQSPWMHIARVFRRPVREVREIVEAQKGDPVEPARAPKQVIVIRSDLKMRRGKEIAQGAHASMAWLTKRLRPVAQTWDGFSGPAGAQRVAAFSDAERAWIDGSFAKITVRVRSEEELLAAWRKASDAGLEAHLIRDSGRTEFHGEATYTALGIGPDWADLIDPVTGELELY